jgi:WD40 repeat protein
VGGAINSVSKLIRADGLGGVVARVFVSHASEDRGLASELRRWLAEDDHDVLLDQDLRDDVVFGDQWQRRLHERLRWADAVVCVVTSAYLTSTWCAAEIGVAQSRGNRLLPVLAEPGITHPLLEINQHTDMTRDSIAARTALVKELRRVDAAGGLGWPDDRSPFPGLRSFDIHEHQVFFGRSSEVRQLADLLRSPAERAEESLLLVVGPSGCGKSSLVRAGLLSWMAKEAYWRPLTPIVPGADPVAALTRELTAAAQQTGLDWTPAQVHHQLDERGLTELASQLLLAAPGGPWHRLLIVVDQYEELLTQAPLGQRAQFAQLLRPALGGPVQVVATLRSEFLDQLLVDSDLGVLPTRPYTLRPLRREALRAVIENPARLAGIAIADDLVTQLVTDTDSGEALPLLAFTLAQLADGVSRGGELSRARYEQLGRVQGALVRQADAALADATADTGRRPEEIIAGLLRLVTVDEQGRPTRQRVKRVCLPELVTRELDFFVRRRLVVTDTDDGSVVMGVAHEAFLSTWQPLVQAIDENVSALRARRAVEQATAEWIDDDRSPVRLWERGQLAAAVADTGAHFQSHSLLTSRVDLSSDARAFLRASIRRDRFRRGRAITILSVVLVLALVAAVIAIGQRRAAEQQRNVAMSRQIAAQAVELGATNPALAAQLALVAYRLAPTREARSSLLSTVSIPYATILTGHKNYVFSAAFSPDGRTLATASADPEARLWDISNPYHPAQLVVLTGHTDKVTSVAFSPDGRTLATASADNTARLWDISNPRQPSPLATLIGHTDGVFSVTFSPDGRTLATGSYDKTARLWGLSDLRQPSLLATLIGHTNAVFSVAFSPDGRTLATASADTTARLWDISNPRQPTPLATLTGHTNTVTSVAFSPDRHTLATASYDTTAQLWDINNLRQPTPLATLTGHTNTVTSVAFSRDGHTLATASYDNTARLWDISNPRQPRSLRTLTGHTNGVTSVAFSPDGHTLATASYDKNVRLWDLPGPIIVGHTDDVTAVAFSPDGRTLATGSYDKTARLWDISNPHRPSPLTTLTGRTVNAVAFSPDGRTLATGGYDNTAQLWDISNPRQPSPLTTMTGHTNYIYSVAFSPDGRTLATGSYDKTARLWDISNPHRPIPLTTMTGHTDGVFSVAFSPDGRTLATGSYDKTARLWDISNPHRPIPLTPPLTGHTEAVYAVAFSPDGRTLATASADTTARLWDISNPRQSSPPAILTGHTNGLRSVAFSPDGITLATASYDTTARLWNVSDLRQRGPLAILTGHTEAVYAVAFSPDGLTLATASKDDTARLWETDVDSVATRVCHITPNIITDDWDQYVPGLSYQPPCP